MKKKTYCIYLLYCLVTGGMYVGYSYNFRQRWKGHKKTSKISNKPLYVGIRIWSIKNFKHKIVEKNIPDINKAFDAERKWIKFLKELGYLLYNISSGGGGARDYVMSEENKKKMSERNKGENNYFYGKSLKGKDNGHYGHKMKPHVKEILLKHRIKYTDQQIQEIKNMYATGQYTLKEIGDKFNIGFAYIHQIVKNKKRNGKDNIKDPLTKPNIRPKDVIEIRKLYASGKYTTKVLAKRFNLSETQINRIINFQRWKNI